MKLCANILGRNIYVRLKFSSVRSSHGLCASANAHSLEGTLSTTSSVKVWLSVLVPQNVSNRYKRTTTMLWTSQLYYSARFDFHDSVASPGNDV